MPFYDVELEGPEVEWVHREAPEFYKGGNVTGVAKDRKKVVKAAYAVVTLEAVSKDEASHLALAREWEAGYRKVLSVTERKR
jgi:hypothetical protein